MEVEVENQEEDQSVNRTEDLQVNKMAVNIIKADLENQ